VLNGVGAQSVQSSRAAHLPGDSTMAEDAVRFRTGYALDAALDVAHRDEEGQFTVGLGQMERLELHLPGGGDGYAGYTRAGNELLPLPLGSKLEGNVFYWQPDMSFLGIHELVFQRRETDHSLTPVRIKVSMAPRPQ
jgi:hypothetical protein